MHEAPRIFQWLSQWSSCGLIWSLDALCNGPETPTKCKSESVIEQQTNQPTCIPGKVLVFIFCEIKTLKLVSLFATLHWIKRLREKAKYRKFLLQLQQSLYSSEIQLIIIQKCNLLFRNTMYDLEIQFIGHVGLLKLFRLPLLPLLLNFQSYHNFG